MVYTVTFSPALDYVMQLEGLVIGEVNRSARQGIFAGGKGINVAKVLTALGIDCVALGFIAGFTGDEIERILKSENVKTDFIRTAGRTRINVKLKSGSETDLNGTDGAVSEENLKLLFGKLDGLESGDILVLSGTVPDGLFDDIYGEILHYVSGKGVYTVVDAAGGLLLCSLQYRPFLIKPNRKELEEALGVKTYGIEDVIKYACQLRGLGAVNVIVSMAEKGAVLAAGNNEVYVLSAPDGKAVNSVGSGDSMVAGFIAGTLSGMSMYDTFRLGVAAGSATAMSETLANKEEIINLFSKVGIK